MLSNTMREIILYKLIMWMFLSIVVHIMIDCHFAGFCCFTLIFVLDSYTLIIFMFLHFFIKWAFLTPE